MTTNTDTSRMKDNAQQTGPYDSMRDYIVALEARGRLLRIKEMDQDQYEATAFAYRLVEQYGYDEAPAFLIERIKSGGQWYDNPVLGNIFPGWDAEGMVFGVPEVTSQQGDMYRKARDHLMASAGPAGRWDRIKPEEVSEAGAPCKEVILKGGDVDLNAFPFLQSNPADAGAYINSASIFMEDPNMGRNVATYRLQVKGSNKIGFNTEIGQGGWQFLMAAKKRGETQVPVSIALGVAPLISVMSASKLTRPGEDELEVVGGLSGKPVELIKSETNDLLVPRDAEMILEGYVTFDMEEEGPYGELYGYMGQKKPRNFVMHIEAITHRQNPWFVNSFAGVVKLSPGALTEAGDTLKFKKMIPNLVEMYSPNDSTGITIVSIDKRTPGDGIVTGQHVAAGKFFAKAIIVVDKDVDVLNLPQVMNAVGTRWQPHPASLIVPQTKGMVLDPSAPQRGVTSKIIIDATKQFPQEGGPEKWPEISRVLLDEQKPEAFDLVDKNWETYWKKWPSD